MKIWSKKIWPVLGVLVIAFAVVVCGLWMKASRVVPQFITMPDGQKYRFVATDWGTNHSQPRLVARLTDDLPAPVAKFVRKQLQPRLGPMAPTGTTDPTLGLWFEPVVVRPATNATTQLFSVAVADQNGVEANKPEIGSAYGSGVEPWGAGWFAVLPRRSPVLEVHFYSYPVNNGQIRKELGRVRLPNPLYRHYPQWQPETLPATKQVGDVKVVLDNVLLGVPVSGRSERLGNGRLVTGYQAAPNGENVQSVFDTIIESPRGTNEVWLVKRAELSDATGNRLHTEYYPQGQSYRNSIPGALWPDEAAWRLKLELTRTSGFPASDLLTFTNVPLPKAGGTNGFSLTNTIGGIQVVLRDYSTRPLWGGQRMGPYELVLEMPDQPAGISFEFLEVTTDTGEKLEHQGQSWSTGYDSLHFNSMPGGAQSLTVTCAVQKTRPVEFLVKPPKRWWNKVPH